MRFILFFMLFITNIMALIIGNPHEYRIKSEDEAKNCSSCHISKLKDVLNDNVYIENISLSCLCCHDGVSGNNVNINTKMCVENADYANNNVGIHMGTLSGHPVSVIYMEGVSSLKPKNSAVYNWSGASTIDDLLVNGKIECGSCHNPHDKDNVPYLRYKKNITHLCMSCHDK